jgi:hypothetical protein
MDKYESEDELDARIDRLRAAVRRILASRPLSDINENLLRAVLVMLKHADRGIESQERRELLMYARVLYEEAHKVMLEHHFWAPTD